jgi:hypothetical protein
VPDLTCTETSIASGGTQEKPPIVKAEGLDFPLTDSSKDVEEHAKWWRDRGSSLRKTFSTIPGGLGEV